MTRRALVALTVLTATLASTAAAEQPSYLWSLPAEHGSLRGPDDRHLTLRLHGTRRYLTRFTDRPLRQAYVVYARDFERRWPLYFNRSRPNAVLTYTPSGGRLPVSIVLELGRPDWNRARATWTFPASRLRKKPDNLPDTTVHITPPYIPNPRSFRGATLVIDNASVDGCTLGQPQLFLGSKLPSQFLPADGRILPVSSNPVLAALYGATYGGDGVKTFGLPKIDDPQTTRVGTWGVCAAGIFWPGGPPGCITGNIAPWALGTQSVSAARRLGWLPTDGSIQSDAAYPLFSIYMEPGDTAITFRMPDLKAPAPGLTMMACVEGSWQTTPQPYMGQMDLYASGQPLKGSAFGVPAGWLVPDGSQQSDWRYPKLYGLIGTTYGGDAQSPIPTFNLPSLPAPAIDMNWAIAAVGY